MISLTPAAATKLQGILTEKGLAGYGLRVFVSGGGCSGLQYGMGFDKELRTGDTVETVEGIQVFVDPDSAQYLEGVNIDFVDELGGGFKIDNPKPLAGCNCGREGCGH
jgi:iron-sulfur cluster assembly protein